MLMKKLLLFLIGGILLIGTYGCANYEEDLLVEISAETNVSYCYDRN